ncbi:NAD-glutamate dehydrogenase [Porticoccus sp. GXU_MW_L64]
MNKFQDHERYQQVEDQVKKDQAHYDMEHLLPFTHKLFCLLPESEYENTPVKDLSGFVGSTWEFIQEYSGEGPKIRVFNPTLEEDGWLSPHSVVYVLKNDMPFLVDSLRIELNNRGINIHQSKSIITKVKRDAKGKAVDFGDAKGSQQEALMMFLIDLHSSQEELEEVAGGLEDVLADVKVVVQDFQPMLDRVARLVEETAELKKGVSAEDRNDAVELLKWMHGGYYTFLGCSEYSLKTVKGKQLVTELEDQRLGLFRLHGTKQTSADLESLNPGVKDFYERDGLLGFTYSSVRSRVHRNVHADYIVVKKLNKSGKPVGEVRLLGMFTSPVYTMKPALIPVLRNKVKRVIERSGLLPNSHDGKALQQLLDVHPRDELFQSSDDELYKNIIGTWQINERRKVRFFMRHDFYGRFVSCMVYVPRDLYNTNVRQRIEAMLSEQLGASEREFYTYLSESVLARIQFIFRVDSDRYKSVDVADLEQKIIQITRNWNDDLREAVIDHYGEEEGQRICRAYSNGFSIPYQEHFDPRAALGDIGLMESIDDNNKIAMSFYQPPAVDKDVMRFKVFHRDTPLDLSSMVPLLENLGFQVQGEHPYIIDSSKGEVHLSDFTLKFRMGIGVDVPSVRNNFQEAFRAIWTGETDDDFFNRLVIGARLDWRSVAMLRMYGRYMKQLGFSLGQRFIADTLSKHLDTARNLVALFKSYFDPCHEGEERAARLSKKIAADLDAVSNLNEDKVLRTYLNLINATLRTNFFQCDKDGNHKPYIAIKLATRQLQEAPKPRPEFEIYVYSPRMEGVHLRGGKVARGGLRWSDRMEDYRTEVLGLVKAQQVKNAVIVPTGSKGCFVAKNLHKTNGREEFMVEGIACYQTFIRGLLDVTDNIVGGDIVPPKDVVRRDEDDPYLVVAADKGTATFSDIANEISEEYGHWLGDAFASGGSNGYDHKGMGITARGAWVAVQRHFREIGINTQEDEFTVIGIGDMGGDVFGNGMLLSDKIRLKVAFNHLHIFIDPNPDAAATFPERQRLFDTPRSTWADFNSKLISKGGGVFDRSAKSIVLTPEIKESFAIEADELAPTELIHELLKSEVDMIWNGGIGTYVKASDESHDQVGDRANDSLRVNGKELRCRVFGEGGNLGLTHRGRIEFCQNGGACNTDFIDNAGGVDCSDHEVNIKILLNELVATEDLTTKQRNVFLEKMTDDVADLVLDNNYQQTQAISVAEFHCNSNLPEYWRFITTLESKGRLDRALEFLPSDEEMGERDGRGQGLVRPELSTLISYAKVELKEALIDSDVADNDYMAQAVESLFPQQMRKKYLPQIHQHSLKREIIATQLANELINTMGLTFYMRQVESTGATAGEVLKAYAIVRDIFKLPQVWADLEALDYKVSSALQLELITIYMRLGRRATRWILRNWRGSLDPAKLVPQMRMKMEKVLKVLPKIMVGDHKEKWDSLHSNLVSNGVSQQAAELAASSNSLYFALGVAEMSINNNIPVEYVIELYHLMGNQLSLDWFGDQIVSLRPENRWKDFARESFVDELETHRRELTQAVLKEYGQQKDIVKILRDWHDKHEQLVDRWMETVQELRSTTTQDFAMYSVALRELQDLSRSTASRQALMAE